MNLLGIDPGRLKSGLAIINSDGQILWRAIIAPDSLEERLPALLDEREISRIALGDSTASEGARAQIERVLGARESAIELRIVDETGSTLEARELYWQDNPRRGWRRLLPLSLQEPPEPIDDYAAAVVARRGL